MNLTGRTPALAIIMTGAALFFTCCERHPPSSQWNLLWVVIDDLKADHSKAVGYERDVTPNLDRLAKGGVRFTNCVTQSPWSLPSYASMLSSRYPYELVLGDAYLAHIRAETEVARSRDPHRMPDMNTHWYVPVPEDVPLIAEVLKREGFVTAGFANNAWLSPGTYGLERGYDHYFNGAEGEGPYTPANKTADLAIEWLRENKGSRWFAFVQLMDPHKPYREHSGTGYGNRLIDRYDSEVLFADRALGRLLRELDELGLSRRTVVVVNSDHGEGVFPRDEDFVGHGGGVIPEIVFVPLVMKWPGGPKGKKVKVLAANLDVMPTVLSLLGIKGPDNMKGRLLTELDEEQERTVFTMAVLKGPEQMSAVNQSGLTGVFQCISVPAYKRWNCRHLKGDIDPRVGIGPDNFIGGTMGKFIEKAEEHLSRAGRGLPPDLDQAAIKNLKALGYIEP